LIVSFSASAVCHASILTDTNVQLRAHQQARMSRDEIFVRNRYNKYAEQWSKGFQLYSPNQHKPGHPI
jgi:hypothetical protein